MQKTMNKTIKKLRKEAGLSPTQLSERSNLSLAFISKLEGGGKYKTLSLQTCKKLAEGLGLSLKDFLYQLGYLNRNEKPSLQMVAQALRSNRYTSKQVGRIMDYAKFIKTQDKL